MNISLPVVSIALICIIACSDDMPEQSITDKSILQSFQFSIKNNGQFKSETHQTIISEKNIRVILGNGNDSLQFNMPLLYSDSLNRISEISLSALDSVYSNDCIADGLQLTTKIVKGDSSKTVFISNFYQPEIGFAIDYINSYVPEKFRIHYDRKQLEEEYIKCRELHKNSRS